MKTGNSFVITKFYVQS